MQLCFENRGINQDLFSHFMALDRDVHYQQLIHSHMNTLYGQTQMQGSPASAIKHASHITIELQLRRF